MTQPLGSHVLTYLIQLLERGVRIIRYYYWRLIRLQDPPRIHRPRGSGWSLRGLLSLIWDAKPPLAFS